MCGVQSRMNGGTNIALAIKQAGSLLKSEDADAARIIVLLTDGRVDTFQGAALPCSTCCPLHEYQLFMQEHNSAHSFAAHEHFSMLLLEVLLLSYFTWQANHKARTWRLVHSGWCIEIP